MDAIHVGIRGVFGRMILTFISGNYFVTMWIVSFFLLIFSKNKSFY